MKKIALFTPSKQKYSETFIQLHIEGLDRVMWVYHDGEQPTKCNDVSFPKLSKWSIRLYNWRYGKKWGWEQWSLFRSLQRNKPDLVYVEYGTTAVANADVIELLHIPMVINFHGFDLSVYEILKRHQQKYEELFQNTTTRYVVVSRKMQNRIIQMGARPEAILYSPCGANVDYQNVSPKHEGKQFVMLGRLVEKKSPLSTIKAFHQVYLQHPLVRLSVIGTGPLLAICQDYVTQHDLSEAVHFHGVLDREAIKHVFSESCCFVQHSVVAENGDEEGTPVAVMEAMLAGLVVVSTRHAGIADIVQDNCGYLVDEHDIEGMALAMLQSINHLDVSSEMTKSAKQFILSNHTSDIHLQQINSFLS
jgi:colanic acid/amylovoran biosynthesis glycosyltransferase